VNSVVMVKTRSVSVKRV